MLGSFIWSGICLTCSFLMIEKTEETGECHESPYLPATSISIFFAFFFSVLGKSDLAPSKQYKSYKYYVNGETVVYQLFAVFCLSGGSQLFKCSRKRNKQTKR
uniref:Uncharacterized protein LOC8271400 isoform X2 n=2 Tax=Rhizophora mucronata TaxID=61149 RepID=A0A2P2JLT1_RHIMU